MIGLMDLTENQRDMLTAIATRFLIYVRYLPRMWAVPLNVPHGQECFLWLNAGGSTDRIASDFEVEQIKSLQDNGLLDTIYSACQVMPSRGAVPLIRWLQGLD